MADVYRTKVDVSIPRVVGTTGSGDDVIYETEGVNYPAGALVLATEMTPRDREQASKGAFDDVLEEASMDDVNSEGTGGGEPDFGLFISEHEAEAHALRQYGHVVVPADQALEAQSAGAEWARKYQEAVAQHGMDRRPAQESMQGAPPRVPEELLRGGETRTGLPHDRGPQRPVGEDQSAESGASDSGASDNGGNESSDVAPRPRPGQSGQPSQEGQE